MSHILPPSHGLAWTRGTFPTRTVNVPTPSRGPPASAELPSLLLGAGFALAALILLPALAQRAGIGSSLTMALRAALMKASSRI